MIVDARDLPDGSRLTADVCVVGAGPAGISIARKLAARSIDVCLLESGGMRATPANQDLYRAECVGDPHTPLDVCQLRFLGGNSNAWGGWSKPLDREDFDYRSWVPHSGWPLSYDDLLPYYAAAEEACEVVSLGYDKEAWARRLAHREVRFAAFDPELVRSTMYAFSSPTRFGTVYQEELATSSRIRCYLHANVMRLVTDHDGQRVTTVHAATEANNAIEVEARLFVLAAGGIENARLLMVSDDVNPNGLGNEHDVLGRYYMMHPHTRRRIIPTSRTPELDIYGLVYRAEGCSARFTIPPALRAEEGLLNYSGNIVRVKRGQGSPAWQSFLNVMESTTRLGIRPTDPYIRRFPFPMKELRRKDVMAVLAHMPTMAAAGLAQVVDPRFVGADYFLESKPEQAPNPHSRIALTRDVDAFGVRRVRLDKRTLPADRRVVVRSEEIIDGELRRLGLGSLAPVDEDYATTWPADTWGGWHQLGTTRMAATPRTGIVDRDCRVFGVGNLFVGGQSIFPTGGVAPPTITMLALAHRLADHLVDQLPTGAAVVERVPARPVSPVS